MTRSTRPLVLGLALVAATAALAAAHDMFLKPAQFFIKENAPIDMVLINGTFTKSENSIARNRLADISVLGPAGRTRIDTSAWKAVTDTSYLSVKAGAAGTYVLGVSTRSNIIELTGQEFTEYLESDGIPDVLAARKRDGEMDRAVKERYHKHVKAMVQVGDARSDHYATALGYPAEVIPVENPYSLKAGATFHFKAIVDGKPVANQYVQFGGRTAAGGRIEMKAVRTNADGVGEIKLAPAGTWYVKFINMTRRSGDAEADYESKWASLTFAVR